MHIWNGDKCNNFYSTEVISFHFTVLSKTFWADTHTHTLFSWPVGRLLTVPVTLTTDSAGRSHSAAFKWHADFKPKQKLKHIFLTSNKSEHQCTPVVFVLTSSWGIRTWTNPLKSLRMTNRSCLLEPETLLNTIFLRDQKSKTPNCATVMW